MSARPLNKASVTAYRTQDLTKVYGEGSAAVHALRGVELEIPAGEVVPFIFSTP